MLTTSAEDGFQVMAQKIKGNSLDNPAFGTPLGKPSALVIPQTPKRQTDTGHCTFFYADGAKYVGEYKDHRWHGDGVFYHPTSGNRIVGEWRNGIAWNATVVSASGGFLKKTINGVEQQQQQSQNQGLTKSQLMELLLLVNLLKRDNNASQKANDWERIFGGGGFTCKTDHYWGVGSSYGDSTTRCR